MSSFPYPIDHLVLPVADLETAEQRYRSLGFTVAPRGQHPFGTANACVYLSDDTFLEPLAISDADLAAQAAKEGSVFVAHDQVYRTRAGQEGLSALVLGTRNASADHERFRADGISAGEMLRFSRRFVGADGGGGEATFLLAFAGDLRAPDTLFFNCERVGLPSVDRTPLTLHRNAVARLKRVILVAPEPQLFETLMTALLPGVALEAQDYGFRVVTATGTIAIYDPRAAAELIGGKTWDNFDPTLQFAAVEFQVDSLATARAALQSGNVAFDEAGGVLRIAPAAGQGVPFLFSEESE